MLVLPRSDMKQLRMSTDLYDFQNYQSGYVEIMKIMKMALVKILVNHP